MGPIPMRIAFAYSVNTVAVRLAQQVGTSAVADMARRFGLTTRIETNPSMALGSNSVRLIDMTRAYASVARGGVAVTPYGISRVTTADGTLLYQHPTDEPRVLVAPWVAAQMTELLQGVVEHGTGRDAALGRPTAGKTGTTSSNKDGWFIGFSSGLTTGVWMGRDDNRALPGPDRRPCPGPRLPRSDDPRRRQPAGRAVPDRRQRPRMGGAGRRQRPAGDRPAQ